MSNLISFNQTKIDEDGMVFVGFGSDYEKLKEAIKEPSVTYIPELSNKMLSGFEFIYPVNAENIFLGGESGFYHIKCT